MARLPVLAAGGIVLRREQPPLIAVVRLRKRDEWVLPKGKLDDGETARAAAWREVVEETGHNVTVHEFLGTLVYESGGRSKVVHYWSMEAGFEQAHELMNDVKAVDWLPLDAAVERLSRGHERTFLENVGPLAIAALSRRLKARAAVVKPPALKLPAARRRRDRVLVTPPPVFVAPEPQPLQPEFVLAATATNEAPHATGEVVTSEPGVEAAMAASEARADVCAKGEPVDVADVQRAVEQGRRSFAQKLRDWLGRAA